MFSISSSEEIVAAAQAAGAHAFIERLPDSYDTIAGDQDAPTGEQIEKERRRITEMDTQAAAADPEPTGVATAVRTPPRASPRMRPPQAGTGTSQRPRPAGRRRGRWFARTIVATILLLLELVLRGRQFLPQLL